MWKVIIDNIMEWNLISETIRLLVALIVGIVIGIDRGMKKRGAGVKTHVLVCLGSAIVMMTSQHVAVYFGEHVDITRMGAQVISGVGFLGVGTIIVTGKNQVRGLTTAAGLWTCACLGLAAGTGYIEGALLGLIFITFTLKVLSKLDNIIHKHAKVFDVYLEFENNKCVTQFVEEVHRQGWKFSEFELSKSNREGEGPTAIITFEVHDKTKQSIFIDLLRKIESIKYVEEL